MKDKNDITVKDGDIIDIHQAVNRQNLFIVVNAEDLDIRYHHDINRHYEYDTKQLMAPDKYTGESTFEIIGNIKNNE